MKHDYKTHFLPDKSYYKLACERSVRIKICEKDSILLTTPILLTTRDKRKVTCLKCKRSDAFGLFGSSRHCYSAIVNLGPWIPQIK